MNRAHVGGDQDRFLAVVCKQEYYYSLRASRDCGEFVHKLHQKVDVTLETKISLHQNWKIERQKRIGSKNSKYPISVICVKLGECHCDNTSIVLLLFSVYQRNMAKMKTINYNDYSRFHIKSANNVISPHINCCIKNARVRQ